jgi:hypothetical protein
LYVGRVGSLAVGGIPTFLILVFIVFHDTVRRNNSCFVEVYNNGVGEDLINLHIVEAAQAVLLSVVDMRKRMAREEEQRRDNEHDAKRE